MTLWRTKLRSIKKDKNGDPAVDHTEQVDYCLRNNVIGVGWGESGLLSGSSITDVVTAVRSGGSKSGADTIQRFHDAKKGEFVWTRHTNGRYLLCKIAGPWRYVYNEDASKVDIHQVRDAEWLPDSVDDLQVPGAVIRNFIGTGSSFSAIRNGATAATWLTEYIWEVGHGRTPPSFGVTKLQVLTDFLDPYDVEDLIFLWLQLDGDYLALPRARRRDNPVYEFSMIHRTSSRRGIVQVKTGRERVDTDVLEATADDDTDVFAFATSGKYDGKGSRVTRIRTDELLDFAEHHQGILPARIRWLFSLAIAR